MRVIIADSKEDSISKIEKIMKEAGYIVVAKVCDGFDAIKVCRQHNPDVILINDKLPLLDGIGAAKIINDEDISCGIVFLTSNINKDMINKIKIVGGRGCITNLMDKDLLISTLEIAAYTGKEYRKIKKEKEEINQRFEDRKAIDKAKGILMVNEKLTEDEAYARIRKYSMEKRVTMREISEFIIVSYKFKN